MTPKVCTITIRPPAGPPPTGCHWLIRTPPDGQQYYVSWPLGKTLAEAAAPLVAALLQLSDNISLHGFPPPS